ncbi:MAG: type II toxin-antitoxin system RelE/ParE family toxin [Chitinispirillaceae bacterium]|jgi:toxin ParE1/3/4
MKFQVFIIAEVEEDIVEICHYIMRQDSVIKSRYVADTLKQTCETLARSPERGHHPPELERIGVMDFREIHFKPYRIIYQIIEKKVFVHCVLDGRRDLQEILERRLLR